MALLAVPAVAVPSVQAATIPTPPALCQGPTSTPVVDDVVIAAGAVDVSRGARSVTVSIRAHDTVAITRVVVRMQRGPLSVTPSLLEQGQAVLALSAGTTTAGLWSGKVVIPSWGRPGGWVVQSVELDDVEGGYASYAPGRSGWASPFLEPEWDPGWDSTLTVTGRRDSTAPVVSAFRSGSRAVDARAKAVPVGFVVTARDGQSGTASVLVELHDRYGTLKATAQLRRTSSSTWAGRTSIGRWAGTGQWRLSVVARDRAGNRRTLTPTTLAARGWASRLDVRSGTDDVPPRLVSMTFPAAVDTTAGAVRVPVTVRVADARSGVRGIQVGLGPRSFNGFMVMYIGGPRFRVSSVTGDAHDRTYHGYLDLPQCWQSEDWYPSATVTDSAGNEHPYSPRELVPPLVSHRALHYVALDGLNPFGLATPAGRGSSRGLDVDFDEPTLLDRDPAEALVVVNAAGAAVAGTWSCLSTVGTVPCQAQDADVAVLHFTPETQPAARTTWTVKKLGTYPDIGIYDRAGNPALNYSYPIPVGPGTTPIPFFAPIDPSRAKGMTRWDSRAAPGPG